MLRSTRLTMFITARKRSLPRLCFYRCLSVHKGGCAWLLGGRAWLLGGACVVAPRGVRGCSGGGMHGCSGGACVVAPGGVCVVALGGHVWLLRGVCVVAWGACVVAPGGHVWLLPGGAWFFRGGAWFFRGGMHGFFHEIRSMSGRYASYWNAFLFHTIRD